MTSYILSCAFCPFVFFFCETSIWIDPLSIFKMNYLFFFFFFLVTIVPCVFARNVYSTVVWQNVLLISARSSFSVVLSKSPISL